MSRIDDKLKGVIAAVPTPFDDQKNLLPSLLVDHCRWAMQNGCDGLNVLGTTGEANSLDVASRKQVMALVAETVDPSRLMVGTATPDLTTTTELTLHADQLGYSVALVLPPYYYKPVTDDGLFKWFEQLDRVLGSAKIAIYLYNFPALTGIRFSIELLARLARAMPQRFCGIKDSSGNLDYCREIVATIPNFKVFPSNEVSLGEAHQSGFAGCISASVNVTSPLAAKLWANDNNEQTSTDLTDQLAQLRGNISAVPLIPAIKYLVGLRDHDSRWGHVLTPMQTLSTDQQQQLKSTSKTLRYTQ
ncbi:MAG: dihydrodipicolinate synthase family protein [Amphritea sp.]